MPLIALRRALERQNKISDEKDSTVNIRINGQLNLIAPTNTPQQQQQLQNDSLRRDNLLGSNENRIIRSATPPARNTGHKSFRSARRLRHQASLKTSAILAKLVGSAGKGYRQQRPSRATTAVTDKQSSDIDDVDTDNEFTNNPATKQQQRNELQPDDLSSVHSNLLGSRLTKNNRHQKQSLNQSSASVNVPLVSPLSSVSSLNSTYSSLTVNSACGSLPNRSLRDMFEDQAGDVSSKFGSSHNTAMTNSRAPIKGFEMVGDLCRPRGRSATVPCRPVFYCSQSTSSSNERFGSPLQSRTNIAIDDLRQKRQDSLSDQNQDALVSNASDEKPTYKVSDLVSDCLVENHLEDSNQRIDDRYERYADDTTTDNLRTSLWLGCDDGSIIIIDCLAGGREQTDCSWCDPHNSSSKTDCGNIHSEIKVGAPVSDIKNYQNEIVFVALANGQLTVFKRNREENSDLQNEWLLSNPTILTLAANELNSIGKLCLVKQEDLWYSYGRTIFVLKVSTLKLDTTIMTPSNDRSLQPITIDNLEYAKNLDGVWVSFKNSPLIQFYDVNNFNLLLETSLLDPINKVLSYGNAIILQHKTASIRATSLLSFSDNNDGNSSSLFIGTSAGIVIYLTVSKNELKQQAEADKFLWNPQVVSLRHGHSGQVKFLRTIELEEEESGSGENVGRQQISNSKQVQSDSSRRRLCLLSGGAGVDLYGPNNEQQVLQHLNSDEDCMNHLLLWKL